MSPEEVKKVLDAIRDEGDKQFEQFILFLLNTGARRNEILFLKWKDINIEKRQLRINAEKTGKELDVPINDALMSVINEMEKKEEGYVFVTHSKRRGAKKGVSPWSPDYVTHHFKDYIRALRLSEDYSVHSLRHTYTTQLRTKGVPLDIIFRLLGHSSPAVTQENYDHAVALHFREQANLIGFKGEEAQ